MNWDVFLLCQMTGQRRLNPDGDTAVFYFVAKVPSNSWAGYLVPCGISKCRWEGMPEGDFQSTILYFEFLPDV